MLVRWLKRPLTTTTTIRTLTTTTTTTTLDTLGAECGCEYDEWMVGVYRKPGVVFVRGEGSVLVDSGGGRYLDFTAGIAVTALGHAHPIVTRAIHEQAALLLHTSNLFHSRPAGILARSLVHLCRHPSPIASQHFLGARVFLCNSGTEANEAAIKFARKYARYDNNNDHKNAKNDNDNKNVIVSFRGGFHGRTLGALSATPNEKYQRAFQPLLPGFRYAEFNNMDDAHRLIDENTCAVLVEPIQGEGGIQPAHPDFLALLRQLCSKHRALLIFDEVQCGIGRTGTFWAHSHYPDIFPDIITIAKPLANGFPIGAAICTKDVAARIEPGDHGSTFGGSPLGCHIANTVLSHIRTPSFLQTVSETGAYLKSNLDRIALNHPNVVVEVRGRGLMLGMELAVDPGAKLVGWLRDHGLLLCTAGRNTLRFVPPLIVTRQEIDKASEILDKGLTEVFRDQ